MLREKLLELDGVMEKKSKLTKEIKDMLQKEYGCSISVGQALTTVSNEFYSVSIWFMDRDDGIKESGCQKMPQTEAEVVELFRSKEQKLKDIKRCLAYLTNKEVE